MKKSLLFTKSIVSLCSHFLGKDIVNNVNIIDYANCKIAPFSVDAEEPPGRFGKRH